MCTDGLVRVCVPRTRACGHGMYTCVCGPVTEPAVCVFRCRWDESVHRGCPGEPCLHTHSSWRDRGVHTGKQQALGAPVRCAWAQGVWAALTASWHSSWADSAEWPPSSACQSGSQRGSSRSSGSAAPAARTPAPTASVSPAGPRVGPAAASGAAVPAGSCSGCGLGLDGCPVTLRRGRASAWACSLQAPGACSALSPNPPGSHCPRSTKKARAQEGSVQTLELSPGCHRATVRFCCYYYYFKKAALGES